MIRVRYPCDQLSRQCSRPARGNPIRSISDSFGTFRSFLGTFLVLVACRVADYRRRGRRSNTARSPSVTYDGYRLEVQEKIQFYAAARLKFGIEFFKTSNRLVRKLGKNCSVRSRENIRNCNNGSTDDSSVILSIVELNRGENDKIQGNRILVLKIFFSPELRVNW